MLLLALMGGWIDGMHLVWPGGSLVRVYSFGKGLYLAGLCIVYFTFTVQLLHVCIV